MAFTYFFRDYQTLRLTAELLVKAVSGRREIKIWDAGCASGQEPYTLAIMLAERMGTFAYRNVKIFATDIDISNQFGRIISSGLYPENQLRRIPEKLLDKYFAPDDGASYRVHPKVKSRLKYQRHNLLSLKPVDNNFSLILCKNVLLHQKYGERVEIIKMFHQSLRDGGLLAMEQTQKLPEEVCHLFEPVTTNASLYRKKEIS